MNLIARHYEKMDKNPTGELRERIIDILDCGMPVVEMADQILEICKESGLKFVTAIVGTDYKDGIPTVVRMIKEIEIDHK